MAIVLHQLLEQETDSVLAWVEHRPALFVASVQGTLESLMPLLHESVPVELSFQEVLSWKTLENFQDQDSGIEADPAKPGALVLRGRVREVFKDQVPSLLDVYLQNGAEFLLLSSDDLQGAVPPVGCGLQLTVSGLRFYPTGI